jgi:LruC domain-containing protein
MKRDLLCLAAFAMVATACRNDVDLYVPPTTETPDPSTYFDFATTTDVDLDIDLGTWGRGAFVMLFENLPVSLNENDETVLKETSLFSAFADDNGKLQTRASLPSGLSKVYLYCSTWGVPDLTMLEVQDGAIRATVGTTAATTRSTRAGRTRSDEERTFTVQELSNNYYLLCQTANRYGAVNDINGIYDTSDVLTTTDIAQIQNYLWKGQYPKPLKLDNSSLVQNSNVLNTSILYQYYDDAGELKSVDGVSLWVTLLTEAAWYTNSFGYYYYKTGEDPSTGVTTSAAAVQAKKNLKKFIVFPNASIPGNFPFSGVGNSSNGVNDVAAVNAPLAVNTRVQLLFQKEDGTFTDIFPPGYTIGFFANVKGWNSLNNWNNGGLITTVDTSTPICTNAALNNGVANIQDRFISMSMQMSGKNIIVYGMEDNGKDDKSYDDMVFIVEATPDFAICNEDRNTVDLVTKLGTEKTRYYYVYEDIWPNGGDYDLNDVIIRHDRVITFDTDNYVHKVTDSFTPVQAGDAAHYVNGFAVHYDADQRGDITLPTGSIDETATGSVILFSNTNNERGQTRTVTRTFAEKSLKKDKLKVNVESNINPFIIPQYNLVSGEGRVEIHLPKATPTSYISSDVYSSSKNAFYIDADGKFPFALALPIDEFVPCSEAVRIDTEYPDFTKWVESNGTQYGTWYLNRVK